MAEGAVTIGETVAARGWLAAPLLFEDGVQV
jgi:hypothetical protein